MATGHKLTDEDIARFDQASLTDEDIRKFDSKSTLTDKDVHRIDNFDVLKNIQDHPFQAIFNPIAKTLTGESLQDKALNATAVQEQPVKKQGRTVVGPEAKDFLPQFARNAGAGMAGSVADVATTPASYIPLPIGKLLGKIPVAATTLGEIASKVPVGEGFMNKVMQLGRKEIKIPQSDIWYHGGPSGLANVTEGFATKIKSEAESYAKQYPNGTVYEVKNVMPATQSDISGNVSGDLSKIGILHSGTEIVSQQPILTPVQKVMNALNEAESIRGQQENLYTEARIKQAEKLQKIGEKTSGEQAYIEQLSSLNGDLPKVDFKGIRDRVSQDDVDSLFNQVQQNQILSPFEKVAAKNGLARLLGREGGQVPRQSEIDLLKEVFPQEFIDTVLEKRPLIEKIGQHVAEAINIPRSLMASFDMSAPLRQGVFLVGRPKQFLPAFGNMFKYFFDENAYQDLLTQIKTRPSYPLMRAAKLPLTDMQGALSSREESFMSRLPEKIPLLGHGVRASNRAYAGFLNKLRADVFDDLVNKAQMQGIPAEGKVLKNISEFVGNATGRGTMPQALERSAVALNSVLFSPRLVASRLNLLNPAYYVGLDPFTRKEALKSLFTFAGTASTVLTLASLGGAKVSTDPRNADFGKIRIGDTRFDILGGFQQYLRFATQLITGEHINSTTGVKTTIGEGYKPITRMDILGRFMQTKENPIMSFATDLLKGKTFDGQDINLTKEVASRFVPLIAQDMADLYKSRGLEGIGMSIPGIFGVGVQTYSPTPSELAYSAKSVMASAKKLYKYGRVKEADDLLSNNKEILDIGGKLEPYQKQITALNRIKDETQKTVRLTPQQKQERLFNIDEKAKEIETQMEMLVKQLQRTK